MEEIRYPIGRFQPKFILSEDELVNTINQIPRLIKKLKSLVNELDQRQMDSPYRPDGWTIRQIIHHMADNDMNAYLRFKRGLTEENPLANTYREDLWAQLSDYKKMPIHNSLALIELLHQRFHVLLTDLASNDFERTIHTEVLGTITLEIALQRFIWHNNHHMMQIENLLRKENW